MRLTTLISSAVKASILAIICTTSVAAADKHDKKLAYIVSDIRIPFWEIMSRGIKNSAKSLGYEVDVLSSDNLKKRELELTVKSIKAHYDGIIISPTNSSSCVTILKLSNKAHIPVVISDIGSDSDNYVSYISSNNRQGAYQIGKLLAKQLAKRDWDKGSVGIIAIPQKRLNGQARTAGFMQAMREAGIHGADIRQQVDFSAEETYRLTREIMDDHPRLRAIWLQGSNQYQAALNAIADAGKSQQMLLLTFDAEPVFLDLIPKQKIVGAAMQQPYLMGQKAVQVMHDHLSGKPVEKNIQLPVLAITNENIGKQLSLIRKNVLGIEK